MSDMTLEGVIDAVLLLSPVEKAQLLERVAAILGQDLMTVEPTAVHTPRRSLLGVWADRGTAPSEGDIDEARREMWANFPREDIL